MGMSPPLPSAGFLSLWKMAARTSGGPGGGITSASVAWADHWVQYASRKWGAPVLKAPKEERRDDFVAPYFRGVRPDQMVVIPKAREPARILISIGKSATAQGHLEYRKRSVDQCNFFIH